MQKKLIVLAITAAFASAPAFADTSVYGLVDAGFGSKATTVGGGTSTKTTNSGIVFSQDQTSRVGVMSSEDLGGGMKAMYQLEIGLAGAAAFTPNAALGVDRIFTAGLDFGQGTTLTIGKMSSPFRGIVYGNDAMYGANFAGNLVTMDTNLTARVTGADLAHNFGAVTGTIGLFNSTTKVDGAAADGKAGNGFEATAVYKQDALSVSAGYRSQETANTSATSDVTVKSMILAANYDMGVAKLYGQFAQAKSDQSVAPASSTKDTYETFGVNMPFTSTFAGYVELGTGKHDVGTGTSPKYTAFAVGGRYDMSKATWAYAHIASTKDDVSPNANKIDQFGLGVVHSF